MLLAFNLHALDVLYFTGNRILTNKIDKMN